jgi:serine/threonine protein kinase
MFKSLTGKEEGLAGLWNFEDGSANDASPAAHHGNFAGQAKVVEAAIAKRHPITLADALYIITHVCTALHYAHEKHDLEGRPQHIIHRDVSPSNIICSYAGEVKLCDFGIAKATLSRVTTKTGVIKGKVKYMSPEQALGRKLDHRSDVFSLGSCLYEMLTRIPPFTATNEMDLLIKVRDAKYRPIAELTPGNIDQLPWMPKSCAYRRLHALATAVVLRAPGESCEVASPGPTTLRYA